MRKLCEAFLWLLPFGGLFVIMGRIADEQERERAYYAQLREAREAREK